MTEYGEKLVEAEIRVWEQLWREHMAMDNILAANECLREIRTLRTEIAARDQAREGAR